MKTFAQGSHESAKSSSHRADHASGMATASQVRAPCGHASDATWREHDKWADGAGKALIQARIAIGARNEPLQRETGFSGDYLPDATRNKMEASFGVDFSDVRILVGDHVKTLGAIAFTQDSNIHFAPGHYSPGTTHGDRLLGHELAHVTQQRAGRVVQSDAKTGSIIDNQLLEREADEHGDLAAIGTPIGATAHGGATKGKNVIQCKKGPVAAPDSILWPAPVTEHEKAQANSIYNDVPRGWSDLARHQILAIGSVYTEAGKPNKPSLQEELLTALCEAALAGALGGIGGILASTIEKKVAEIFVARATNAAIGSTAGRFRDAAGRFVTDQAGRAAAATNAKATAKLAAEFSKDAMKEGVKSLSKPEIKKQLSAGKQPIDAFFLGQMLTASKAGRLGGNAAEKKRVDILDSPNPVQLAQAASDALDDIFDASYAIQMDETLKKWLIYQAGIDNQIVAEGRIGEGTTDLARETSPGLFGSRHAGTLYVVINKDLRIRKAVLKGSTANMVALLADQPINRMGIPVIVDFDFPGIDDFYVNVNEKGFMWLVPFDGGAGNAFLRKEGGATESMGNLGTFWVGGDPVSGARTLWDGIIGRQKVKGILEPDK